jgi:hypothetical protein
MLLLQQSDIGTKIHWCEVGEKQMPETCDIREGGLKCHDQTAGKYFLHKISLYGRKFFLYSLALVFSYIVTKYVFSACILADDLQSTTSTPLSECISLGSIFATFGSAVIAVLSLTSSSQISSFDQKLAILQYQFSTDKTSKWMRWEFLPRQSRKHIQKRQYQYYRLDNAELCFEIENKKISLPIPTCRKDFIDLSIFSAWWKMCRYKSSYSAYIYKRDCIADFLIWNCLHSMYKNIILYRISEFFISIGAAFIINSIVFAFSYR